MSVEVICGNCLEALRDIPSNSVDAVIADPPYSSGGYVRADRSMRPPAAKYVHDGSQRFGSAHFEGDNKDQRSFVAFSAIWMQEALRVVRPHGKLFVFTDWRQLGATSDAIQAGCWIWRGVIPWDKGAGARAPHTGYHRHRCEYILWASRGPTRPASWGGPWPGLYRATVLQRDKHHLTGKPTALMRELVRAAVPPGGVVLDPFAGSGTTGVAAKELGRAAVLIEMNPKYCALARERIAGAQRRLDSGAETMGSSRKGIQASFLAELGSEERPAR